MKSSKHRGRNTPQFRTEREAEKVLSLLDSLDPHRRIGETSAATLLPAVLTDFTRQTGASLSQKGGESL